MIDWIFESIGCIAMGIFRGIAWGISMILRGVWLLLRGAARAIAWPFAFAWRKIGARSNRVAQCLRLDGEEFEEYAAQLLRDNGFRHVEVTQYSGDQGVDILARRNGISYAIQCKNYSGQVGNFAVQEAYAGMKYYGCDRAAVLCPGGFTRSARELAESTGVLLWDGRKLSHMMRVSGRRPRHKRA